jgi:hypothetical protein
MHQVILPKPFVFFWFVFSTTIGMNAQQDIDHWEAVVMDGTFWHYLVPTSQPNAAWNTPEFNDDSWLEGPSGFGYGDGDDATIVSTTPSLYLRHTFQVENIDSWLDVDFFMDYDDGFVAYLNGTEIARGNAGDTGTFIAWNQNLATDHEAVLYAGGIPPIFDFDFAGLLVEGENTLSIELHNVNPTSSDLTARPFLMVGTTAIGLGLETPPAWFNPMTSDVHDITFNLNMTNETVSPTGVFVAGGSFFGVAGDHPMTDSDGDGTWTVTIPVPNGFTGYYTFLNGNCLDWSCKENIAGLECAHPENYNDRMLDNIEADTSVSTCFGQCTTDGSCAEITGCTSPEALNYLPVATEDDGSCIYFDGSNLPIVELTTDGPILDDPRIVANMAIINNASGFNQIGDSPNDYDGLISIEIRGSSSQMFPKKSYALETQDAEGQNNNVSLLGMPEENDWILYGPYTDKTLMRNAVVFELGEKLNRYTPRRRYCELFINGDYRGVYMLMENIKRDENRVDIATLLPEDIEGNELTGGYILKIDKFTGDFNGGWQSPYSTVAGDNLYVQFHKPEMNELNAPQIAYIEGHITAFEDALAGPDFSDPELGYMPFIDVYSFIDLYLINELSKNIDGYRLSTYFYKQKDSNGGKIVMGPWWDYNLSLGNADYCEAAITEGFEVNSDCGNTNPFWWERMLEDPTYRDLTRCRWEEYRSDAWSNESIHSTIDSLVTLLGDASARDHARWPRLGQWVWPNSFVGDTYEEELDFMRNWIDDRLDWLDMNILGDCEAGCTTASACNFNPEANYNDGTCEPCACPGDINGDLAVTVADVLFLLAEFGCTSECTADLNDDGLVSISDLLILLSFYSETCA